MEPKQQPKEYFLGLDIGTNSIGYAVTDTEYRLLKHKGEPMWGVHTFESAASSADRRSFRAARRRLDRRQQRVLLTQELFAKEIGKVDPEFFTRIKESAYCKDDRNTVAVLFRGQPDSAKQYNRDYPTIHHLLCELMERKNPHDVRLVYLAVAYLMAHRGHFLKEVDKSNIQAVLDFDSVYRDFVELFTNNDLPEPWICDSSAFAEVLKKPLGIKAKNTAFNELLYNGKKPTESERLPYCCASMLNLLSGGKEAISKLFRNDDLKELGSISLSAKDEDFEKILAELSDDAPILIQLKSLYDWSLLTDLLAGCQSVSKAKVKIYEQHRRDLVYLKSFVRRYLPDQYGEVFRFGKKGIANYVAYSYHTKSVKKQELKHVKRATNDEFCDYIKKLVRNCPVKESDRIAYEDMMARLESKSFMPKQVNGDNRVIPYQLYYDELKQILENAESYLPFLSERDADGLSVSEKLLTVFEFRIPYYVGPLRKDNSQFAWIERKAEGELRPWNFERMVDLDASEKAFIDRMTKRCTYLPGERVLPKCSLLYQEFEVLNELNNVCIDNCKLPPALKIAIIDELFKKRKRVTPKQIGDFLKSRGYPGELSGLDTTVKSSLSSYCVLFPLLERGVLTEPQAEQIIERFTYTESKTRQAKWLDEEYPHLTKEDRRYLLGSLKCKDFGNLSRCFLTELCEPDPSTGEYISIMDALRNTQENLMQLLSGAHSYRQQVDELRKEYYLANPRTLSKRLDEMYIPSPVKRQIFRTLDVVSDIQKVCGEPKTVFIEMARGGTPEQKGKRTQSRRSHILDFYKHFPKSEVRELSEQLGSKEDRELQSEALYLYFIQLGKCMYSGQPLDISQLKSEAYNIDHIYPQSKVKDDSIDNKVLVLSTSNNEKSDHYPIDAEIRSRMTAFWHNLHQKGLISSEKWRRLTRSTSFSPDEKWGFINRQLVETRQSTKAVAALLRERFPNSEICYVKAGLASDYRQKFNLPKARSANDLHHAKDAYLNIVVGNVYHNCFSKRWFSVNDENYSIKVDTLFGHERRCGGTLVWRGAEASAMVRKTMGKNTAHLTRYAFCRHHGQSGGLFNQNPEKATSDSELIPRKINLPVSKYGGYNNATVSFFILAKYLSGKTTDVIVMPVELLYADRFRRDEGYAKQYAAGVISRIIKKPVDRIEFPLGLRELKINTVFSFGGFRACLGGKYDDSRIILYSQMSLAINAKLEAYIKRLESFSNKLKKDPKLSVDTVHDRITAEENNALYHYYSAKLRTFPFNVFWKGKDRVLDNSFAVFCNLSPEKQVECLLHIGEIFKSNRSGGTGCDLSSIGASRSFCKLTAASSISAWAKFGDVRIIDTSASGLFETSTGNLLELP